MKAETIGLTAIGYTIADLIVVGSNAENVASDLGMTRKVAISHAAFNEVAAPVPRMQADSAAVHKSSNVFHHTLATTENLYAPGGINLSVI